MNGLDKFAKFDLLMTIGWLDRVLQGKEYLKVNRDESVHMAIVRLCDTLPEREKALLRDAETYVAKKFFDSPNQDESYAIELVSLVSELKKPHSIEMLSRFADSPGKFNKLSLKGRQAALSGLVYAEPLRSTNFWIRRIEEDVENYGAIALSGLLAIDPVLATDFIWLLPSSERMGHAVVLKLEVTWMRLSQERRLAFIRSVEKNLGLCGGALFHPIKQWLEDRLVNPSIEYKM